MYNPTIVPVGVPIENPDQLSQINWGLENAGMAIDMPEDKLAICRFATVSDDMVPNSPRGDIVMGLFSGKGFALNSNETHVLRMNVELIKDVDPAYLKELIASNKSIEEIKEGLMAKEGVTTLRGSMSLDENSYFLANIKFVHSKDNVTIVDADIDRPYSKPDSGDIAASATRDNPAIKGYIAGHIKVNIVPSGDGMIGKGELTLNRVGYSGKYTVLLSMNKPQPGGVALFMGDKALPS